VKEDLTKSEEVRNAGFADDCPRRRAISALLPMLVARRP
jgi:hypothetical protein